MSASLVGSEMCIRDRRNMGNAGPSLAFGRADARGRSSIRSRCCAGIMEPVSYTHLTLPTICSV
eukprot:7639559-Alexandrium_andersonii.AAC.1